MKSLKNSMNDKAFTPFSLRTATILATAVMLASASGQLVGSPGGVGPNWNHSQPSPGATSPTTPILYYGGPLLTGATLTSAGGGPTVYLIWYGNWNQNNGTDTPEGQQIVYDFLSGLSIGPYPAYGSPYMNILTTYSTNGFALNGKIAYGGSCSVGYLSSADLDTDFPQATAIFTNVICGTSTIPALLPLDPNGIYMVLMSSDVTYNSPGNGNFCSTVCGYHANFAPCGTEIKLIFVINIAACLNANCAPQSVGPNGNAGVDAMISMIAHELAETITDPVGISWHDATGLRGQNADKCQGSFGQNLQQVDIPKYGRPYYNITLPSPHTGPGAPTGYRNYLVQRILAHNVTVNGVTGDYCSVSYDPVTGAIQQ